MTDTNDKIEKKFKKTISKKIKKTQTNKFITEETQPKKNTINTIKNFEKLLITEPDNLNKSQKNFFSPDKIKYGNG